MVPSDVLLARQPIFDEGDSVIAYELLARASSLVETFAALNSSASTAKVMSDAFLQMDVWSVTGGLPAYINFTRELLLDGIPSMLPPELTVIEVLEDVEPDADVIAACRDYRAAGYRIALDDVGSNDPRLPLLAVVDIAKIDFLATTPDQRRALAQRCRAAGVNVLAEKVETRAAYEEARALGCTSFQGYYFQKPALVRGRRMSGARVSYLRLLSAANANPMDYTDVEMIIKHDVSLAWKFLNYMNAAFFGWRRRIESIRQGLVLLGENGVRRWVSLMTISALGDDLPRELLFDAIVRAKLCEEIAGRCRPAAVELDAFLVGMFSLLDAMVNEPMADILAAVSVPEQVAAAILEFDGVLGKILELVVAYERGEWAQVDTRAAALGVGDLDLMQRYLGVLSWASDVMPSPVARSA